MIGRRHLAPPLAVAILSAAAACGAAATTAAPPKLRVTPARGHPGSTFTVHFTAPAASGRVGAEDRRYELSAAPAHARSGCIDSVSLTPVATAAGEKLAVALRPRRLGGRWCAETYTGEVDLISGPDCGPPINARPAIVCPEFATIMSRVGTFRFRVRRR